MNFNGLPFDQVLDTLYSEEPPTSNKSTIKQTAQSTTQGKILESKYISQQTLVLAASVVIIFFASYFLSKTKETARI